MDTIHHMSTPNRDELLSTINAAAGKMPARELAVLARIATRLLTGYQQYGALSPGKKKWAGEAAEEAFDMAVYLSCLLLEKAEGER